MENAPARVPAGFIDRGLPVLLIGLLVLRIVSVPPSASSLVDVDASLIRGALVAGAVIAGVVQLRGTRPLSGLIAASMLGVAATLLGYSGPGALLPAAWSLFVVARDSSSRVTTASTLIVLVSTSAASFLAVEEGDPVPQTIVAALSLCLAAAVGVAVRGRRELEVSMRERAERAESSRDEEARRRVVEDRLRIARELHDVIAHHMAIINVQASVARHLLRRDPDGADDALGHVRQSSQVVLEELGTVLNVLRSGSAPLQPAGSPASLPGLSELIDSFSASGATVTADLRVEHVDASPDSEQAVYRVVQEALTNAHRYAAEAPVHVAVRSTQSFLEVDVENARPRSPSVRAGSGTGYGILGLRERVESLGGDFSASPTAHGGFRVAARVPLRPEQEDPS